MNIDQNLFYIGFMLQVVVEIYQYCCQIYEVVQDSYQFWYFGYFDFFCQMNIDCFVDYYCKNNLVDVVGVWFQDGSDQGNGYFGDVEIVVLL